MGARRMRRLGKKKMIEVEVMPRRKKGTGMKYGGDTSTRWYLPAKKWPNSWARRIAMSGAENTQPAKSSSSEVGGCPRTIPAPTYRVDAKVSAIRMSGRPH